MTSSSVTRPKLPVPITEKGVVDVSVTAHGDGGENITIDLAKGVQHHDGDTAIRKAHHRTSTKRHIKGVRPSRCAILERCNSAFGLEEGLGTDLDGFVAVLELRERGLRCNAAGILTLNLDARKLHPEKDGEEHTHAARHINHDGGIALTARL